MRGAQASGENLLRVVPAFCARLAGDAAAAAPITADMQPSVYMDFLAHKMVWWQPFSRARKGL